MMKEELDKSGNVDPATLSQIHNDLGELIWMAGAIEAAQILAVQDEPLIEVVH